MPKTLDIVYRGFPLTMRLPLKVEGDVDCCHVVDAENKTVIEGLMSATDAHYLVDAVNMYHEVRAARRDELVELRGWIRGYMDDRRIGSFGGACLDIMSEIARRIDRLRK